jgi:ribosomal protein L17
MMLQRKKEIKFAFLFIYEGEKKFMASASSSSKPPCATCGNKSVGVFKCEGCSHTFCRKHSNEHRDSLIHQLDEIVLEHDTLQQTIVEQKEKQSDQNRFIEQIDKWEKESIVKIQQRAKEARQQVEKLIDAQNGN